MAVIKVTIFLENRLWIGSFERTDQEGYAIARHIFGKEPTDPQIHQFVLENYQELKFGEQVDFKLEIRRVNPKRMQREVRREMEKVKRTTRPSTFAQDYMREELEKKKKQKRKKSSAEKKARDDEQFFLKQEKRKKKHKGH